MIAIESTEYAPFYQTYITAITDSGKGIVDNLQDTLDESLTLLRSLSKEKENYAYADGKWTIKEVLQHIIDTERIFAYRALRIARKDKTPLPGFEQNDYVDTSNAIYRDFSVMLEEFELTRKSTILLFKSLTDEMLLQHGEMSGNAITVRALGYICSGHVKHHINIINERYI